MLKVTQLVIGRAMISTQAGYWAPVPLTTTLPLTETWANGDGWLWFKVKGRLRVLLKPSLAGVWITDWWAT